MVEVVFDDRLDLALGCIASADWGEQVGHLPGIYAARLPGLVVPGGGEAASLILARPVGADPPPVDETQIAATQEPRRRRLCLSSMGEALPIAARRG